MEHPEIPFVTPVAKQDIAFMCYLGIIFDVNIKPLNNTSLRARKSDSLINDFYRIDFIWNLLYIFRVEN